MNSQDYPLPPIIPPPCGPQQVYHYHENSLKQKLCYLIAGFVLGAYFVSGGCAPALRNVRDTIGKLEAIVRTKDVEEKK